MIAATHIHETTSVSSHGEATELLSVVLRIDCQLAYARIADGGNPYISDTVIIADPSRDGSILCRCHAGGVGIIVHLRERELGGAQRHRRKHQYGAARQRDRNSLCKCH